MAEPARLQFLQAEDAESLALRILRHRLHRLVHDCRHPCTCESAARQAGVDCIRLGGVESFRPPNSGGWGVVADQECWRALIDRLDGSRVHCLEPPR